MTVYDIALHTCYGAEKTESATDDLKCTAKLRVPIREGVCPSHESTFRELESYSKRRGAPARFFKASA